MNDYLEWAWRVIVLSAAGVGVLVALDHFGALDAIGQTASGFLGMALGVVALIGAFAWLGEL